SVACRSSSTISKGPRALARPRALATSRNSANLASAGSPVAIAAASGNPTPPPRDANAAPTRETRHLRRKPRLADPRLTGKEVERAPGRDARQRALEL